MPLHSFKCPNCGIEQEELFKLTESVELTCYSDVCLQTNQDGTLVGTKMIKQPGSISGAHFTGTDFHNGQGF